MPKRKAQDLPSSAPSPTRRRTRANGPPIESQSAHLHNKNRTPTGSAPASEIIKSSGDRESSKENDKKRGRHSPVDSSEDELDVLGSSGSRANAGRAASRPTPAPSTPRRRGQVLDAVVITTPKYVGLMPGKPGEFVAGSPTQSRPRRDTARVSPPTPGGSRDRTSNHRRSRQSAKSGVLPSPSSASAALPDVISLSCTITSPPNRTVPAHPLPRTLPSHLTSSFCAQKQAVLHALQHPPLIDDDDASASFSVLNQLTELLQGTIQRDEGNSCLILGPRGSGKSRLVDRVLASSPSTSTISPVIIRLSAYCQTNDRLAMREIARQVYQQIGPNSGLELFPSKDEEQEQSSEHDEGGVDPALPPPSHLPGLISGLPGLGRPVVVVLDGFDGFATHARQALLYCLLDTVQSCRGGSAPVNVGHATVDPLNPTASAPLSESEIDPDTAGWDMATNKINHEVKPESPVRGEHGILVIGMTSRVDCLSLLEKRVKSRFSHRVMRVRNLTGLDDFLRFARSVLEVEPKNEVDDTAEWKQLWASSVEKFLDEPAALNVLKGTFALVKDVKMLCHMLTSPVVSLTTSSPWLTAAHLLSSVSIQRCPRRFPFLSTLPYPHIALLIAVAHIRTTGHDTFNFEILYNKFMVQVRTSASAPVQMEGSGIGMVKVGRCVMVGAFEDLIVTQVFRPVATPSTHVTKEFAKYRCVVERDEIKGAVDALGQTNMKKWFTKAP